MPANPVEMLPMFSAGFVTFVLLFSGTTKLGRTSSTLDAMRALRVPAFAQQRWVAVVLPLWEIAVGLELLLAPGNVRAVAGAVAVATFAVFTALLIRVLVRGETVDCGCFGVLATDDRVNGWTVARNIVLIVAAAVVSLTSAGHPSFLDELLTADPLLLLSVCLAWAVTAVIVLAFAVVQRRRTVAPAQGAPGVSPAREGDLIPDAELVSPDSVSVPLLALGSGSPVLLVFLSAECAKCVDVARRLAEWQQQIDPVMLRVATSSRPALLQERMSDAVPFTFYGALAAKRSLGVRGSAAAVLLGGVQHPRIASPVARGEEEIEALVQGIIGARRQLETDGSA